MIVRKGMLEPNRVAKDEEQFLEYSTKTASDGSSSRWMLKWLTINQRLVAVTFLSMNDRRGWLVLCFMVIYWLMVPISADIGISPAVGFLSYSFVSKDVSEKLPMSIHIDPFAKRGDHNEYSEWLNLSTVASCCHLCGDFPWHPSKIFVHAMQATTTRKNWSRHNLHTL